MSALTDRLQERIRAEGPITFHEWMKAALYDPDQGYYCRSDRERWGRLGDYRTSPERSVLFAATFARYFAKLYLDLGSPPALTIVEVGAGAGHFAETLLETLQERFPDIFSKTHYYIDEVSPDSRSRAQLRLARFGTRVEFKSLAALNPLDHAIVFSNELLDAFPVHRVIRQGGELRELHVGLSESGSFEWTVGRLSTPRLSEHFGRLGIDLVEGQTADVNLEIETWLELVSAKLRSGYLITVDYGAESSVLYSEDKQEGSLRSFYKHQVADDVLLQPGQQDITSSVDWVIVKMAGARNGLEVVAFKRQDRFLLDAGLLSEMELRVNETPRESERLRVSTSAREMILPGSMAESFQVMVQQKI
ncbi:MAG: SAM-dependent methyltransferase [Pyrinomonadaceae bacterium]|nr:SAM-dependent methyltransferase [Pyrinomonadaceae bacterium]